MKNIVQIQLLGNNFGYLEVDDQTAFPLTFAVSEIRDITKKKGTFSKSIVLPGSKTNNKLLNHYFDVNIQSGAFNINKIQYCTVIQNGVSILDNATLQLISVNKTQLNGNYEDLVTYTVLIKDTTADFFSLISNKYLTDISGFTFMNHIYTPANVILSFDNTIADGYKYIMPYNEQTTNVAYDLTEFSPGIYARLYMDKIFSNAGYSYNWPEMNSENIQFDKLIIPYNGDVVKTNLQDQAQYLVLIKKSIDDVDTISSTTHKTLYEYQNSFQLITLYNSAANKLKIPVVLIDPAGLYNPTTSTYTSLSIPSDSNNIKFKYNVTYEIYVDNPTPNVAYLKSYKREGSSVSNNNESLVVFPTILAKQLNVTVFSDVVTPNQEGLILPNHQGYQPGITILQTKTTAWENTKYGNTPNAPITFHSQLITDNTASNSLIITNFYSTLGGVYSTPPLNTVNVKLRVIDIDIQISTLIDIDYGYNIPVNMIRYIPEKIKQNDFLKSIFTMYNLYAEVDKDNLKLINLTTRDKFYDDGKINNWTKKLAKDKTQEVKFLPELITKKTILTYKQDTDDANVQYETATKEIYGQVEYIFENEYVKDSTKQEIIFSPTPMTNTSFGAIVPLWVGGTPKNNIRILFDGGMKQTDLYYRIYNYTPTVDNINNNTAFIASNLYPHISHFNKPKDPTLDINFALCDYYFFKDYDYGTNTNNTLFNLFWRRTFSQINNGKLLTAYFNLNEIDIRNMSLSDKIRIDNSWWNINKIIDYDANSTTPTKVELISIDDSLMIPFETRNVTLLGKNSNKLSFLPKLINDRAQITNVNLGGSNLLVQGMHNYINKDVVSGYVIGDNNTINNNSMVFGSNNIINDANNMVFGNNNLVDDGLNNIMILGNGFTADTNNTLYTNNLFIPSGGTINNVPIATILSGGTGSGSTTLFTGGTGLESVAQINTLYPNTASGEYSLAIGRQTTASGYGSYAEGIQTIASGEAAHAEGFITTASGQLSHAEGGGTIASGDYSHSEGFETIANNAGSHAEGFGTIASGQYSHSEGVNTTASGNSSHAGGEYNTAQSRSETVIGHYSNNLSGTPNTIVSSDTVFRIGNGTSDTVRSDAFRIYNNGAAYLKPITPTSITSPIVGMIAFNSITNKLAVFNNTIWQDLNPSVTDTFVTGGTYSSGTAIFTNNTGGTFSVTGFPTTGGSGTDTFVTGGTYSNGTATFKNNFNTTFDVTGFSTGYTLTNTAITSALGFTPYSSANPAGYITGFTDTYVTGGTHTLATGISTFTNNTGGTFNVSGYSTGGGSGSGGLNNGTNYIIVKATGTTTQNGAEFNAAYTAASSMSPSATNRINILMAPGYYTLSFLIINQQYVDITSLTGNRDVFITTGADTINISVNDVRITGLSSLTNAFAITTSAPLLIMNNCKSGFNSFNATLIDISGTFINCEGGNQSFAFNALTCSGTFINCKAGTNSFNGDGYGNTGLFLNCIAGNQSFGVGLSNATGTGDNAGSYIDCIGGNQSFAYGCAAVSGFFFNSKSGNQSFGSNSIANTGLFIDCVATQNSFGTAISSSSSNSNTGTYNNCVADTQSFGYNQIFNGISNNCVGSTDSFGGGTSGVLSGKLYYSKLTLGTFKTVSSGGRTVYCIDGSNTPNNQ